MTDTILLNKRKLSELKLAKIFEKIAECDKNLNEGSDSEL